MESYCRPGLVGRYYSCRISLPETVSVPNCRMALVSGNDVTSDRTSPDVLCCAGGSLYIPVTYRPLPCVSMGDVDLTRRWPRLRQLLAFAGLVLIGLLVMQARVQASYWHDSEKLWRYVLRRPITLLPVLIWELFSMRRGNPMLQSRSMKRPNEYSRTTSRHTTILVARLAARGEFRKP